MDERDGSQRAADVPAGEARPRPEGSHIPAGSVTYARLLPALLVVMAVIMGLLIVIAAGVLLGFVPYR